MAADIEKNILPFINDPGLLVQDLQDLVIQDVDISEETKQHLCKGFPWKSDPEKAEFIKSLICFVMDRKFIKKTARINELLATGRLSPSVVNYIFDEGIPKPCRHFCGRQHELDQLHELLEENGKVFIHGIPGIGKSELAKAYAKNHQKDYTNILYISYSGSLKKDITELPFADDRSTDAEKDRFRKHNRFLRTLKDDTLIIIDNFDILVFMPGGARPSLQSFRPPSAQTMMNAPSGRIAILLNVPFGCLWLYTGQRYRHTTEHVITSGDPETEYL